MGQILDAHTDLTDMPRFRTGPPYPARRPMPLMAGAFVGVRVVVGGGVPIKVRDPPCVGLVVLTGPANPAITAVVSSGDFIGPAMLLLTAVL